MSLTACQSVGMKTGFSRKHFLRRTMTGLGAVLLPPALQAKAKGSRIYLQSCRLAGLLYNEGIEKSSELRVGHRLSLRAEPTNPHDRYAVKLFRQGQGITLQKLGYLPRNCNHVVSHLLPQNIPLHAEITALYPEERPDRQVQGKVEMA